MNTYQQTLLLLIGVCLFVGFHPALHRKVDIPGYPSYKPVELWECWIGNTYTKISIIEGEVFKATLHTETFGKLILRGNKKMDELGMIHQLFGSIEKEGNPLAIGTFFINKAIAVGEQQSKYALIGELHILAEENSVRIVLRPLQ